ncbi:MAG: DinB family protein [Planctomycetota bacterium]|nr:DinB family protein [Planctomycetota bacterium]
MSTATDRPARQPYYLSGADRDALMQLSNHELILRYRRGLENIDRRVFLLSEGQLDHAFLPDAGVGNWPARVLLGHLADAELAFVHRMRRAIAEDGPVVAVWDENAFIDANIYGCAPADQPMGDDDVRPFGPIGAYIAVLHTLRQWTSLWLSGLTEQQMQRVVMHPINGPTSVKSMLVYAVWHVEHHCRFLAKKLDKLIGPMSDEELAAALAPASGSGGGCCGGSGGGGCGCKK